MARPKLRLKVSCYSNAKARNIKQGAKHVKQKTEKTMNINRFQEHELDETLERKLDSLGKEPWWRSFIFHVNSTYNELTSPSSAPVTGFGDGSTNNNASNLSNRGLHWAITTAAHMLSANELPKRLQVLSYVVNDEIGVQNLLFLLEEVVLAAPLSIQLSFLIREAVNPRNPPARAMAIQYMLDFDALYKILNLVGVLNNEIERQKDKDAILEHRMSTVNLFWVLSAMAAKDSRFGLNLKTLGRIKFLHMILRQNLYNLGGEVHQPFLKVLRIMCKSASVGTLLRGDKIFLTIKKLFEIYNYQPCLRFQLVLDILLILTKSTTKPKLHSKKFLKSGLLISLMRAFNYWPMWKGKGLLKLSKTTLVVYGNLALTACGRKTLLNTDALVNVRRFCESCPNDKLFDDVVVRACGMVALANGRNKLPFKELTSPAKFDVPDCPGLDNSKESGTSSDEDDPDDPEQPIGSEDDENSDESDVEQEPGEDVTIEDGDDSDEDEIKLKRVLRKNNQSLKSDSVRLLTAHGTSRPFGIGPAQETPIEKLASYGHFFKELDGKIAEKRQVSNKYENNGESILLSLLAGNISTDSELDAIPKMELKYLWPVEHPEYANVISQAELRQVYLTISRRVRSVIPFIKIAYPDFTLSYNGKRSEQLNSSGDRHTLRSKVLVIMGRAAGAEIFKPRVIYDLDALVCPSSPSTKRKSVAGQTVNKSNTPAPQPKELGNNDEKEVGQFDKKQNYLYFESRFESGNLRKAIQVGEKEYDLYLMSDVNSTSHNQWFYFQISNIQENLLYTFNIVNCDKANSQFNFGMQPVVFSVMDAMDGKPGWVRSGSHIVYHKNGLHNENRNKKTNAYHSATFSIMFQRRGDICYIAYHYPYTYTRLMTELWKINKEATDLKNVFIRQDLLCYSLNKNEVPVVTITAQTDPFHPVELRDIIVFTARVHPGEPNASWVMHGILHKLVFGTKVEGILQRYIFKIVPMLNVEGVINGCHRCGLTNDDLNRRWKNPHPVLHPTIYNAKALIEYSCRVRNKIPVMYCDLHGHSRKKNVFLYGCSRALSWWSGDRAKPEDPNVLNTFPEALAKRSPFFAITCCNYDIRKTRESTARVALWREFGISRSYTLESSYCGFDRGPYKGVSLGINHLIEVGESLCESCEDFYAPSPGCSSSLYTVNSGSVNSEDSKMSLVNLEEASYNETENSDTDSEEEWEETTLTPLPQIT